MTSQVKWLTARQGSVSMVSSSCTSYQRRVPDHMHQRRSLTVNRKGSGQPQSGHCS